MYVGQLVYLPGGGTTSQPQQTAPIGRSYVVRSGDTLWAIAQRELGNGNRWREIKKADGTPFTDAEARTLYVGQVVYLPGSSQTGGTSGTSGSTQPADFAKALAFVRRWEGGYVNHPSDPGGATNKGITQNTYDAYRASKGLPTKDVRWITDAEVDDIYYTRYWIPSGSNQLTSRLAMVHFDTAVNMGVGGASGLLQQARQSSNGDEMSVVRRYLDLREARYRAIVANNPSMGVFLQGWLNRLNSLRAEVEAMGGGSSTQQSSTGGRYYYVKAGDTPFGIAQRELGNGNRWREIRKEDGTPLTDWDATRLQIGQRLILPGSPQTGTGEPIGVVDGSIKPIQKPTEINEQNIIQGIAKFFTDLGNNPYFKVGKEVVTKAAAPINTALRDFLLDAASSWNKVPGFGHLKEWIENQSVRFANGMLDNLPKWLDNAMSSAMKKASQITGTIVGNILLELPEKIRGDVFGVLLRLATFNPASAIEKISQGKIGEIFDSIQGLAKSAQNFGQDVNQWLNKKWSQAENYFNSLPKGLRSKLINFLKGGTDFLGFFGDVLDIVGIAAAALDGDEASDPGKEFAKVIASAIGGAIAGVIIQPVASAFPGVGNVVLGIIAAIIGSLIAEFLVEKFYDTIKGVILGFGDFIAQQFSSLAKIANDKIKFGNSGGGAGIIDIIQGIFIGIPVYAEVEQASNVAQLWRQQFGTKYDYLLSNDALYYLR